MMLKNILKALRIDYFSIMWRNRNHHNETRMGTYFDIDKVEVGKKTYGQLNIQHYNKDAKLRIGNYCSIADKVYFLLGGEHDYRRISSWSFNSKIYKKFSGGEQLKMTLL